MQNFINNIIIFINQIYESIANGISTIINESTFQSYRTFLFKNIFTDNSLIGLNITWMELFRFLSIWVLVILFIVIFVKFILKIIGLFRFNRLND